MLTNCFRFAPLDSVPGIIAKICKYLKAHPGWSIEELKEVIGDIETSLAIGEVSYFTNQSINDLNILELYYVGYRFVFIGGEDVYGVMYALEKSGDNVVANGVSLGVTTSEFNQLKSIVTNLSNAAYTETNPPPYPVTKVNGRAGEVSLDLPDVLGESTAQTMLMTKVNFDSTELATWNAFYNNGYRVVGVVSDDGSTITAAYILGQNVNNHAPIQMAFSSGGNVASVNGDIGEVFTLRVDPNDPGIPTDSPVPINATTLNGKDAKYYIQNRNLLDNSDFRNPVNQRGQTSYTTFGYTIDRWYVSQNSGYSSVSVNNGIEIAVNSAAENFTTFLQYLDTVDIAKKYTFAVCDANDNVYLMVSVPNERTEISTAFGTMITKQLSDETPYYGVTVNKGTTFKLKWVALYEGEYTAENLPPYIPKGYAVELAECDLYYRPLGDNVMSVIGMTSSDGGNVLLKSTRPMRDNINPTIINNGTLYARVNGADYAGTKPRINKSDKSGVEFIIAAENSPAKQAATLHGSALFALSRDL